MKKGCIIAAIVVLVLALIGIGGCVFFFTTKGPQLANAGAALAIETAIAAYQDQNPDAQIAATNEAWAEALQGFSFPGGTGDELNQFVKNGKIVDALGNEMAIEEQPNGSIKVISPEHARDEHVVGLFRREAESLRSVRHDAVIAQEGAIRTMTAQIATYDPREATPPKQARDARSDA